MMKTRNLLALTIIFCLAVPVALATAKTGPQTTATIAKKKKKKKKPTWCQNKAKREAKKDSRDARAKVTYKRIGFVKAAKFSLFQRKIGKRTPDEYYFCSESPKFAGAIEAWSGIKKTSNVRAVKNNCAAFYSETKDGYYQSDGQTVINTISYHYFRKNSKLPGQTNAQTLGMKGEKVVLGKLVLTKNCVLATTSTVNGVAQLKVNGIGDFPFQDYVERSMPGATAADLKSLNVSVTGPGSVLVKWTQAGAPQQLEYPGTMR